VLDAFLRWLGMKKAAHGGMNRPFIEWKRKSFGGIIMH
jgi:hypothetical protein